MSVNLNERVQVLILFCLIYIHDQIWCLLLIIDCDTDTLDKWIILPYHYSQPCLSVGLWGFVCDCFNGSMFVNGSNSTNSKADTDSAKSESTEKSSDWLQVYNFARKIKQIGCTKMLIGRFWIFWFVTLLNG